jgi:hypothetical protein
LKAYYISVFQFEIFRKNDFNDTYTLIPLKTSIHEQHRYWTMKQSLANICGGFYTLKAILADILRLLMEQYTISKKPQAALV